ncbi:hypothetical protein D9615_002848 [Tricholomella constricta]|uniref:Transmembrane protein n=1 Tax=Tricholomella constricta TaxID=117010 RepID=A0A8H5HFT2_9AGAR|nr:hypothetical protein D9615_002848 [Tricholomella constricta]
MALHFVVDDQSKEISYLCPVTKQTVSGSYLNNTWTTIASDECQDDWFQHSFHGTGVEIVVASSKAEQNFFVKIDDGPWVRERGRGRYISPPLVDGQHTVSYAAGELELPTFDYLIVKAGPSTPLQGSAIVVDDSDSSLTYTGAWTTVVSHPPIHDLSTSAFKNSIHWSTTIGDALQFDFTGSSLAIFGIFANLSLGQNFSATYTLDGVSTTGSILAGTLDGLPMTRLFSTDAPAGNHTLSINITHISPPLAVGFDFLTYNASFANLASVQGYQTPVTASHHKKLSAGAIFGAVAGGITLTCTILLVFILLRKKHRRILMIRQRDKHAWSELK